MILFIIILLFHLPISALVITASFFNANYSASNPLVLEEDTTIELDENMIIATQEALFILQNSANPISLVFTQNNTHEFRVFVSTNNIFNASSFITADQKIIFRKTNLVLQDAASILLQGGHLAFFKQGTISFEH